MFDIHQRISDEGGELDHDQVSDYVNDLMNAFADAPEGKLLIDSGPGIGWAATMMEYSFDHLGLTPVEMDVNDFNEIVFRLFPRKVSVEPERAAEIVGELRAFWTFVERQYGLGNAAKIRDSLGENAADQLHRELTNPANYGMAKSFFVAGKAAGFDMTTQEGLDRFMLAYNSRILARPALSAPITSAPDPLWELGDIVPSGPSRAERRKARKLERQAKKRNRR